MEALLLWAFLAIWTWPLASFLMRHRFPNRVGNFSDDKQFSIELTGFSVGYPLRKPCQRETKLLPFYLIGIEGRDPWPTENEDSLFTEPVRQGKSEICTLVGKQKLFTDRD